MSEISVTSATSQGFDSEPARVSLLLRRLREQRESRDDDKIGKTAREFESILLTHWLEQAQQSLASVPGGDEEEDGDPGRSQFQGLGLQSLATAITASGGLGIATLISHQLRRPEPETPSTPESDGPSPANGPRYMNQSLSPKSESFE